MMIHTVFALFTTHVLDLVFHIVVVCLKAQSVVHSRSACFQISFSFYFGKISERGHV